MTKSGINKLDSTGSACTVETVAELNEGVLYNDSAALELIAPAEKEAGLSVGIFILFSVFDLKIVELLFDNGILNVKRLFSGACLILRERTGGLNVGVKKLYRSAALHINDAVVYVIGIISGDLCVIEGELCGCAATRRKYAVSAGYCGNRLNVYVFEYVATRHNGYH